MMVAQVCDLEPGDFVHTLGDAHLYLNHLEQARLQLTREPRPLPTMQHQPRGRSIDDFDFETSSSWATTRTRPSRRRSPSELVRTTRITLIAAVGRNRVIGARQRHAVAPARRPRALQARRRMGHTLVMGRKTFDSIGRAAAGAHAPSWSPASRLVGARRRVGALAERGPAMPAPATRCSSPGGRDLRRGAAAGPPPGAHRGRRSRPRPSLLPESTRPTGARSAASRATASPSSRTSARPSPRACLPNW